MMAMTGRSRRRRENERSCYSPAEEVIGSEPSSGPGDYLGSGSQQSDPGPILAET